MNTISNFLIRVSNLILTLAVYIHKYTKPKKEKHFHNILVIPPQFYDYGAEDICRNADLEKTKTHINSIQKQAYTCYFETFGKHFWS